MVEIESPMPAPFPNPASASGPKFAHPSEEEFARILDFYGLRWDYEPTSFPLEWKDDGPAEMMTPDFYLPDLELYLELTTMKQSLVTQKNRKIRKMRATYPDIRRQAAIPQGLSPPARQVRIRAAGRAGRPAHIAGSLLRAAGRAEGGGTRQGALRGLRRQASRRWSASSAAWSVSWPT